MKADGERAGQQEGEPCDDDRLVLPKVDVVDVNDVDDGHAKAATSTAIGMAPKIAAIRATTGRQSTRSGTSADADRHRGMIEEIRANEATGSSGLAAKTSVEERSAER